MFSKCDWWIHLGYMLRVHSRYTPNVIGGYIEGKMIQYLQFTQDVLTGFQDTSPPVKSMIRLVTDLVTGKATDFYMRYVAECHREWTLARLIPALFDYCFPNDIMQKL